VNLKFDDAAKSAQESRYYQLAANNRRHFLNPRESDASKSEAERAAGAPDPEMDFILGEYHVPPDLRGAVEGYRYYHLRALATAAKLGAANQDVSSAYAEEAFGCHFLTDSFSAGHVRTERDSIQSYWNTKHPMFFLNLKGVMAEEVAIRLAAGYTALGRQVRTDVIYDPPVFDGAKDVISKTLDGLVPLGLGDLVSGALHDYDNKNGVRVESEGQAAIIYGDGNLGRGDTKQLAVGAVRRGAGEVTHAHRLGREGNAPKDAVRSLLGEDGLFSPERMVPRASSEQGVVQQKTQWKFKTVDDLLADPQIVAALRIFATEQVGEIRGAAKKFPKDKADAIEMGFVAPLLADPAAMVHRIVNWTPSITDSVGGVTTDDHANDYTKSAKKTPGGLRSLTYEQRENLVAHLLQGNTIGDDENAIIDILRSAPNRDAHRLVTHFGWKNLHDKIDDGPGNAFDDEFPESMY